MLASDYVRCGGPLVHNKMETSCKATKLAQHNGNNPQSSLSLAGADYGGRGVPGGKGRRGERKADGRMRRDRDERGERETNKIKNSVRFPDTLPVGPQPGERLSLAVPYNGTGPLWWLA